MDILTGPTTESKVQAKWNSLLNAYKSASDTQERTGRAASTFQYMDLMDEIFGNRPIMANSHTVNLYGEKIRPLEISQINKQNKSDALSEELNASENGFGELSNICDLTTDRFIDSEKNDQINNALMREAIDRNVTSPSTRTETVPATTGNSGHFTLAEVNTEQATGSNSVASVGSSNPKNGVEGASSDTQKSLGKKGSKDMEPPFSFRRTKTTKEIVQEKKEQWEKQKMKAKAEARMDQIRFVEEKKEQRHRERCSVLEKILDKM